MDRSRSARTLPLCFTLVALGFAACAPAIGPADGSAQDAAAESATPVGDASTSDVATDAPTTCVDVAGAWEWTGSCSDPRIGIDPNTCQTQTGCMLSGYARRALRVIGNVATQTFTQAVDSVDGVETVTFNGDTATTTVEITAPIRATCMATGRRVTFPGATSYCCDVSRASCGAGQRCAPVQVGTANFVATACLPEGTTPLGGTCMREMDRIGADTCAGNTVCANLGQPAPTSRVCSKICSNATDCGANEICRRLGETPQNGLCRPRCALLGSDCQPAATCRPVVGWSAATDRSIRWEPTCEFSGMRTEGMACANSFDCAADLVCFGDNTGGTCRRACDMTHACPANFTCSAFGVGDPTVTNMTGLGGCTPN